MHRISQRLAMLCGSLCLALALLLVLIGNLSSRYILEQQSADHLASLAGQLAVQVAPAVDAADLVRLEATLRSLRERHGLQQITVNDLDQRPLGQTGAGVAEDSVFARAAVTIDGNIAGELVLATAPDPALQEQRGMFFGLLVLGVLGSLFAAALAGRWGQQYAARINALRETLGDTGPADDEIESLSRAVDTLPLDLLRPPPDSESATDFQESGLLYVNLASLVRYVETLDEHSLLEYTEAQREMIAATASLYGGQLSVAREFGILLSFAGEHPAGSPAFRAISCGWLLRLVAADLDQRRRLSYSIGLACGIGESGREGRDIYPALYNQHIIEELAARQQPGALVLSEAVTADADVAARCMLEGLELQGFEEPYDDLLERQRLLLAQQLAGGA
ncbi:MAG: hypothetical protein V2I66_11895 [Halieaceae bacterium]|nr:hypothetical protein [Halieaceae bacterium]